MMMVCFFSCNPFAPGLDETPDESSFFQADPTTVDGVFQNIKLAYMYKDTVIYGEIISANFVFVYRDYERGVDVSWGRDEEMRATNNLFRVVQRLDLNWNVVVNSYINEDSTDAFYRRGYKLTVTFNPGDIITADGYAAIKIARQRRNDSWMIVQWRDESDF